MTSVPPLRDLAHRCGLAIGTCVSAHPLRDDPDYRHAVLREFDTITPENGLKFVTICPSRHHYSFAGADALVEFAEVNGKTVRGHVLIWHEQLPNWLTDGQFDAAELTEVMTGHIAMVVSRYRGKIRVWDVVNESIAHDGSFRDSIWYRKIGRNYVDLAFHAAREADPDALLFYNDFGAEATGRQSDAVYRMLRDLVDRGVPVDGVGLQMHLDADSAIQADDIAKNLERLAALGLRVHITELDVRIKLEGPPTAEQLSAQANAYAEVLRACLDTDGCDTLVFWGVSDRYSWIPHFFPGYGAPLIFDQDSCAKPAYHAMVALLTERSTERP